ncbi:MAG: cytochrome c biogenesis protein CcsA [Elusimicrobiales bacterium]|nr:cytochrome c biogenesis protein CcsA [Elusimicrobiales bacterium]
MEKAFIVVSLCVTLYQIFFKKSHFLNIISFLILLALVIYTMIIYRHFPVTGLFETLSFFAFSILGLKLLIKEDNFQYNLSSNIIISLLLSLCLMASTKKSAFTPDALNTILFPLHVAFSFVAYASFTLAFCGALSKIDTIKIQNLNYIGFVTFTIGLWTGGIWAYKAWGAYFLYSIKEIFSFVIWIYYASVIHIRFIKNNIKLLKISTIIGFIIVIFTYIGIGLFMKNTHSLG